MITPTTGVVAPAVPTGENNDPNVAVLAGAASEGITPAAQPNKKPETKSRRAQRLGPKADKHMHMQLLLDSYCITDHDDLDGTGALIDKASEVGVSCDLFSSQPKCFVLHCDLLAILL